MSEELSPYLKPMDKLPKIIYALSWLSDIEKNNIESGIYGADESLTNQFLQEYPFIDNIKGKL